jgi:hypothetical protein
VSIGSRPSRSTTPHQPLQNMIDEWDSSQDEECNPKKQEEQSKIVDKAYNQVTKYAKKLNYEG